MPEPEAENVTEDAVTEGATDTAASVKARFKEALDKKNATAHTSADGATRTGAVHGSETQGPVRRTFRRKAG
jgi:hypothetical protein